MTVLAGLGGAYLLLMFLKIRGLIGFKEISPDDAQFWTGFASALGAAALAGALGNLLFGFASPPLVSRIGKSSEPRELRTIWGLAAFPAAAGFILIVLLDIVIAGREAYTKVEGSSLVTGWSAGSLAIGLSLGVWSLYLFVQGLRVAAEVPPSRSIMVVLVGLLCLMVGAVLGGFAVVGLVSLGGLLWNVIQAVNK